MKTPKKKANKTLATNWRPVQWTSNSTAAFSVQKLTIGLTELLGTRLTQVVITQITTKRNICHLTATLVTANLLPWDKHFGPPAFHLLWRHKDPHKIMPLTTKNSRGSFLFHIHRYFLLDMPQTPQQGLHFALLLGWKFAANNFYLAAAIFCWLGRRRPGAGGCLSLGLGRRGNSWLDGRLWRRRIDAISKKVLLLHLLLDLLGMRLWRRRMLTRNVRFFCPHCHLFNAFKILHDVSGNVFRQATFKFGVIGIAFLPFLHTYQQISKRIQIMCGYILPPKKFG